MKKMTCPRCGNTEAADFIFRVLCPQKSCDFYDAKLAAERDEEKFDEALDNLDVDITWLDELALGIDFVAGPGYVIPVDD